MKSLFNRWCGHQPELIKFNVTTNHQRGKILDLERRLERSRILRERAEQRLQEASQKNLTLRKQRDDLNELLQETTPDLNAVIDLLINAKRVAGLNHSGPALARHRIDQAIALLREGNR